MQPIPAVIDGNTASALGIEAHGSRLRVVSDRKRIAKRRVAPTAKLTGGLFLYVIDFAWAAKVRLYGYSFSPLNPRKNESGKPASMPRTRPFCYQYAKALHGRYA